MAEMGDLAYRDRIHVAALQEPPRRLNRVVGLPPRSRPVYDQRQEARPLVALVGLSPAVAIMGHLGLSTEHIAVATIAWDGEIYHTVSCYFPPNDPIDPLIQQLRNVVTSLRRRMLIMGDFNAWHTAWGSRRTNHRGEAMMEFLVTTGLEVVNPADSPPTFQGAQGDSHIDLTIITPDLSGRIMQWEVKRNTASDHASISFWVATQSQIPSAAMATSWKAVNWDRYRQAITESGIISRNQGDLSSEDAIDQKIAKLTEVMCTAVRNSSDARAGSPKRVPWWSKELSVARRATLRARKDWLARRGTPAGDVAREVHALLARVYRRKIARAKRSSWRAFIEENCAAGPWGTAYRVAVGSVCESCAPACIPSGGIRPIDPTASYLNLLKATFPVDDPAEDTPMQRTKRRGMRLPPGTSLREPWDDVDLQIAVKKQNPHGAPGPDGISARMVTEVLEPAGDLLLQIFNSCLDLGYFPRQWKVAEVRSFVKKGPRDLEDPKSYRPISLLSVLGKILETLMVTGLGPAIQENTSPRQYGNVKGRSPEDAIVRMWEDVEAEPHLPYAIAVFFDIAGAFDHAWWPEILCTLQGYMVSSNTFALVSSFLQDRRARITTPAGIAEVEVTMGCPQGSVMGPPLWKALFNGLLGELDARGIRAVGFVDDLAVTVHGRTKREVMQKAEEAIAAVSEWCDTVRLSLSERKTSGMVMRGTFDRRHPPRVRMGATWLSFPEQVTYLGVTLSEGRRIRPHVQGISDKANKMINALSRLSAATWGLKFQATTAVYRAAFLGSALYACSAWARFLKRPDWDSLRRAQRAVLLRATKAYRTVSTDALQVIAGAPPIDLEIVRRSSIFRFRRGIPQDERTIPEDIRRSLDNLEPDAVTQAKAVIDEYVLDEWQRRWAVSTKGEQTRKFFPNIRARTDKGFINPNHWTVQVLSGHGKFCSKLASFRLKDSPLCECGGEETADHVLFHCTRYDHLRMPLFRKLHDFAPTHASLVACEENFRALQDFTTQWGAISTT